MENIKDLSKLFEGIPYAKLGFAPTPLYKAKRASEELGVEIYFKRDDLTGPSVFGGNKIRKLEFLMGDALEKKATHVITHGATQSNHAMQTATAANILGLKPILYLVALVEPDESDLKSNLFLNKILGAETNIISLTGNMTEEDGNKIGDEMAEKRKAELEKEGYFAYDVPIGGSTSIGALGLVKALMELPAQMEEQEIDKFDYIFLSTGSGGTMAGILAGREILNWESKIVGITASPKGEKYKDKVVSLTNDALKLLKQDLSVTRDDFIIDNDYIGEGYEIPTEEASNAIKYFARKEGILFDPVYTGKAVAGLLNYIEKGLVPKGSKVLYYHTGGGTGLFAEKEIVGNLID
ncbi:D-cysteine desulfhydrase family protein [Tissierella sp. MSJ-40]|uniref:D-cysteine desulfhydrase family protein n=1 Tax=Tissierella simiarum TaxID=2841534 RepID=A0ABS6E8Y0_9FIRM|nr:D-cysteine desulfhydrase family protein [Tissierella simiarum]MBU5439378.1 D-cysteine desulfhydrase family protein [Tissierella simiarum]